MTKEEQKRKIQPLDFVRTPKGAIAMVTEVTEHMGQTKMLRNASIAFIGDHKDEKSAWWTESEGLEVLDTLPSFLARELTHPFGNGKQYIEQIYPKP